MTDNLAPMSPTEWLVYRIVALASSSDGISVDEVQRQLSLSAPPRSHQTVASLLQRLFDKGWVHYEASSNRIRFYRAAFPYKAALESSIDSFLDERGLLENPQAIELIMAHLKRKSRAA